MSATALSEKEHQTLKHRVVIGGCILFCVASLAVCSHDGGAKERNGTDISVFDGNTKKASKKKGGKQIDFPLVQDDAYGEPEKAVERDQPLLALGPRERRGASLIEESIGMSREEAGAIAMASIGQVSAPPPNKVVDMFSELEQDRPISKPKREPTSKDSSSDDCETVERSHGRAIITSASEVRGLEKQAKWSVTNQTSNLIALVVAQDKKDVGVAFVLPNDTYASDVAGTQLTFTVKSGTASCINWEKKGGIKTAFPVKKEKVEGKMIEMASYYEAGRFETLVEESKGRITAKTKRLEE